jgi:hypothetical protein
MEKIKEYFSLKAVSNSLLGAYMNPRYMKLIMEGKVEDPYRKFFVIGAALDCQLTSPER